MQQDLERRFLELALKSGKKFMSSQSGYVSASEGSVNLYHNFLYALALFRSKSHTLIQEARPLLDKLLYLQQNFSELDSFGAFGRYLHDFPTSCDRASSIRILRVLYWIKKEFYNVLGKTLAQKLDQAMHRLLLYCQNEISKYTLATHLVLSSEALFCAIKAQKSTLSLDEEILVQLDTEALSDCIASYHVCPELLDYTPLWHYLAKSWHAPSHSFVGPGFSLMQDGFEPQVSLYDYYMALFTSKSTKRLEKESMSALEAALVRDAHALPETVLARIDHGAGWSIRQHTSFAASSISPVSSDKQFPLYIVSGPHSLALQVHKGVTATCHVDDETIFVMVDCAKECFIEDKEAHKAMSLYFDNTEATSLTVDGGKATCFSLTEPVTIRLGLLEITLHAKQVSEDAEFLWHAVRANRPNQVRQKVEREAYDVELFLRALRGTRAQVQLQLSFNSAILDALI
jgi:hypothetical protein